MTNFELYSKVWMKQEQLPGVLLDLTETDDGKVYATVESRKEYSKEGSSEKWPIYYCLIEDLEPMA